MSSAWEMVNLDPGDLVVLRLPMYWLTVANKRCWYTDADGVVVLLNKADGRLRIGERILCPVDKAKSTETF